MSLMTNGMGTKLHAISLLTGGGDRPYVVGLARVLMKNSISLEIIGSDGLDIPEWHARPGVCFLNLRGNQRIDATLSEKISRVLIYYARLIGYAWNARARIFHILWNNKFESFDRTALMLYYKALGKRVVLTAHNINKRKRDKTDTALNRLTLKFQYRLADHVFVHTEQMRRDLIADFGVASSTITVIPFGVNATVPNTQLTPAEAKERLGIQKDERTILFFGRIAPYKGLEYLIDAFQKIQTRSCNYRLVIAGRPDNDSKRYWESVQEKIVGDSCYQQVLLKIEFIPDDETELYFKAGDVLVLPYRDIYQSGVLFLAYGFGLPVIAANVGGLRDEIIVGETGYLFNPEDPGDLAVMIERFFESDLYRNLDSQRGKIRGYAFERSSWEEVGRLTRNVYKELLNTHPPL